MNSQKRKIVGFVLVLALLMQSVVPAFAAEYDSTKFMTENGSVELAGKQVTLQDYGDLDGDGTFYYVAVGDSVTAGMGTKGTEDVEQKLVQSSFFSEMFGGIGMFSVENYKNCAKDSYPYLVAQQLFEALTKSGFMSENAKFDYDVHDDVTGHDFGFSNMGLASFEVNDVVDAMINPYGSSYLLSMFVDRLINDEEKEFFASFDEAVKADGYNGCYEIYTDMLQEELNVSETSSVGAFVLGLTEDQMNLIHVKATDSFETKLKKCIKAIESAIEYFVHDQLIGELSKADVISLNLGSNDLLTQFLMASFWDDGVQGSISNQKYQRISNNRILKKTFSTLSNLVSSETGQAFNLLDKLMEAISEAELSDILDLLTILDSENIRKELEVYAVDVINGYQRFVDLMRKGSPENGVAPINPTAKIVFVGTINPFGTDLNLGIFDADQEWTGETMLCDLPNILNRLFDELKETVKDKALTEIFTMQSAGEVDIAALAAGVPAAMAASVAMGLSGDIAAVIEQLISEGAISSNPALYFEDAIEWAKMADKLTKIVSTWSEEEKANFVNLIEALKFAETEKASLAAIAEVFTTSVEAIFTGEDFKNYIAGLEMYALFMGFTLGSGEPDWAEILDALQGLVDAITRGGIGFAEGIFIDFMQAAKSANNEVLASKAATILGYIDAISASAFESQASFAALRAEVEAFVATIKLQGGNDFWKGVEFSLKRDFGKLYNDFMTVAYNVILKEGKDGLEFVRNTARNLYEAIKPTLDAYTEFVENFIEKGMVDYSDYVTDPAIIITAPSIYFGKGYDNKCLYEELPELFITLDEFIKFFEDSDHYFTPQDIYDLLNSVDDIADKVSPASVQFEELKFAWIDFVDAWEEFNATAQAIYNNVSDEAIDLETFLINHYRTAFNQHGFISVWNQMSEEAKTVFNRLMVHEFINAVEFAEDFTSEASVILDALPEFPREAFIDWIGWLLTMSRSEAEDVIEDAISSIAISFDDGTVKAVVQEIYNTLKIVNNNIIDGTIVGAFTAVRALQAASEFRPIVDKFIDWSKDAVSTTAAFISEGGISPAAARISSLMAMTREDLSKIAAECAGLAMQDVLQSLKDIDWTSPQAISEALTTSALRDEFTKALIIELIKSDLVSGTAVTLLDALHGIDGNLPPIDPIVASLEAFGSKLGRDPYYTVVVDVISATAFNYLDSYGGQFNAFKDLYTSISGLLLNVTSDKAIKIEIELAKFTDNIDSGMKGMVLREFAQIVVDFINGQNIPEIVRDAAGYAWVENYQSEVVALINLAQAVEDYIALNGFYTLIPALDKAIGCSFDLGIAVYEMYNTLRETAGLVVERGSTAARLTKTFADAGELLVDSVKTVRDILNKGVGELLGDSKSWTKFITSIAKDPVTLAKVAACLLTDDDVKASASAFLRSENLSFPLIYLIFGNTASKPIQEMNSRLDKLAKEFRRKGDDVEFVDIYALINESNFDPHPETANHRLIADMIADAILDDISINPKRMTLTIKNDFGRVLSTGTFETFNSKATVEVKAAKDCIIESVKLNDGRNLNTGLFASNKSYKDTITYKNGDELVVTFKNTNAEPEYTVTFDLDDGVLPDGFENPIVGVSGTELPTPTREGYTFDGWFDDNESKVEAIRANETLHAHWTQNQVTPPPAPSYSGSSGPKEYTVTLDPNGGNLAEKEFIGYKGDEITAVPTKVGYNFLGWFTAKEGGKKVETISKSTTLYAQWELSNVDVADKYIDVNEDDWFYGSVQYLTSIGAMEGIDEDEFKPLDIGTRAQVVEILYNIQGCPSVSGSVSYPDVKKGDEWYDAVLWATQNKVVLGYGNGNFGPEDPITREQLALVLMRYTGDLGLDNSARADISNFKDYKNISDYATDAMRWAVATKLIQGNDLNQLNPGSDASRAEIAAILERYAKTILGK